MYHEKEAAAPDKGAALLLSFRFVNSRLRPPVPSSYGIGDEYVDSSVKFQNRHITIAFFRITQVGFRLRV